MSFREFTATIAQAWSGETVRRLEGLERRLGQLDGRSPGDEDKPIGGLIGPLVGLDKPLHEGPKIRWQPSFFNAVVLVFVVMLIAGLFVFAAKDEKGAFLEYLSYAAPLAAGFSAGIGLYRKEWEVPAFISSVSLLVVALFSFLKWKSQLVNVGYDLIGYLGLLISLWLMWLANRPVNANMVSSAWERKFALSLFFASVTLASTWTCFMATSEPDWVSVGWRYVLNQSLKSDTTNAIPKDTEKRAMQTPSGVAHFCSLDNFADMDYLRSKCIRPGKFPGLIGSGEELLPPH